MKIAIVGAAGQVGVAILRQLSKRNDVSVFGITRNEFSASPLRWEGHTIKVGSVSNPEECRQLLEGCDIVINAALNLGLPKYARRQNQAIIGNLIKESGNAIVVHLSTVSVYGSCIKINDSNFDQPQGDSTYAKEKLQLELYAKRVARSKGSKLVILRLGHVYGPGQGLSKQFFDDIQKKQLLLPFDGRIDSNTVHVNRLADAIPGLYNNFDGVKVFNAVNEPQIEWRELYDLHSIVANLQIIGGMTEQMSLKKQAIYQKNARRSLFKRASISIINWIKNLPINTLVDQHPIRESMDAFMLMLPLSFENKVYRHYQTFAAQNRISTSHTVEAYPWYYSDPVEGPSFLKEYGKAADAGQEQQEIAKWYSQFAAPSWRDK